MSKYELALVVNAKLDDEAQTAAVDKVKGYIEKFGGTITEVKDEGVKKLAYEIQKMTEAFYYKKLLMDNDWDMSVLKSNITERIDVNIIINQNKKYEVQLNFCPKCKSRLKIGEEECPSCGITIEEYLSNN